ncbi:MAG TPA: IclR family transcriptional regulator [Solirubrobacteraceae bacterium]|jgi:IclR family pca regulon transcriptional regulator|nr:IclR family transcriptional regulator [Solirubrobacteraceae bacterium]
MTTMSPIRGGILHLPTSHEGRYSQSLERGLAILTAFTPDRPWMGIAELAETLEMSRPTTHRYASTLVALDYLEQGPRRKYRLGMRAGDPGRAAVSSTVLGKLPQEYLDELRDRSTCTASVAVLHGSDIVYIRRARSSWQGESEVARRLGRGSRLPASRTAMGKLLLAHVSRQEQCDAIDAYADRPGSQEALAAREKLISELESIRQKGIAIADQVYVGSQRCIAAPVMSRSTEVIAAVDVAAPKSSFTRARLLEQLAPMVVRCAERMSRHLGHTPGE